MPGRVGASTAPATSAHSAVPKRKGAAAPAPAASSSTSLAPAGGARKSKTPDPRPASPEIERGVTPSPQQPNQPFSIAPVSGAATADSDEGEDGFEEVNVFPPGATRRELSSFDPISPPVVPRAKRPEKRARTDDAEGGPVGEADESTTTGKGKGRAAAAAKKPRAKVAKAAAAVVEEEATSSSAAGSSRPRRSAVKPAIVDLRPTELDGRRRPASESGEDEDEEEAPAAKRRAVSKPTPAPRKGAKKPSAAPESDSDESMTEAAPAPVEEAAAQPTSEQEFPPDDAPAGEDENEPTAAPAGDDEAPEEEAEEEEDDPNALVASAAAPRVRIVNGEVVLDEDSLQVERDVEEDTGPVVQEDDRSRAMASAAYSKRKSAGRWSKKETDKFFDLLEQFGQNFELIAMLLPGRTRAMCIRKLAREDRIDSVRVDKAIRARKPIDKDALAAIGITADAPTPPEVKDTAEKETAPVAEPEPEPAASTSGPGRAQEEASDEDDDDFEGAPFGESAPFGASKSKPAAAPAPAGDSDDEEMEAVA